MAGGLVDDCVCKGVQKKKAVRLRLQPKKNEEKPTEKELEERRKADIIEQAESFVPWPYVFRMEDKVDDRVENAQAPPFWVLIDHTLATVWTLFVPSSKEKAPLGIVQLSWALEFLKSIRSRRGHHPRDVKVCIQILEDRLIDQYAAMKNVLDGDETICNWDECQPCHEQPQKEKEEEGKTAGEKSTQMPAEKCPGPVQTGSQQENVSPTFNAMMERDTSSVHSFFRTGRRKTSVRISEEALGFSLPPSVQAAVTPLGVVKSKSDLMEYLNNWREEQMNNIKTEMRRLHSIEKFMSTVSKEKFEPLLQEDVANKVLDIKPSTPAEKEPPNENEKKATNGKTKTPPAKK